ncbi:hypothetical protein ABPG72_002225 [Tetrahymena utriculariae]
MLQEDGNELQKYCLVTQILTIISYLPMKISFFQLVIRNKKLTCQQLRNYRAIYYILFILWITFFGLSSGIISYKADGRAFIVSQYLLIFIEIHYFILADFRIQMVLKLIPIAFAIIFSGIIYRVCYDQTDIFLKISDILLFICNSLAVLIVSYKILKIQQAKIHKNRESTDSKIHTDTQKDKCDKNYEYGDIQSHNKKQAQPFYQEDQYLKQNDHKINLIDGSINHVIGSKQQVFKSSGANLSNYHQDRQESNLTLKNIEIEEITKNVANTPKGGEAEITEETSIARQISKQSQKQSSPKKALASNNKIISNGQSKNYNASNKQSNSFLQNARTYDDQIQKTQFEVSFNLGVNKIKEDHDENSNNLLLQDFFKAQHPSSTSIIEPQSQKQIQIKQFQNSTSSSSQQKIQYNSITFNAQQQQIENIACSGMFANSNERSNIKEKTAIFNYTYNQPQIETFNQNKNSQIIEKSSEDLTITEINNEFEICYNILNCIDFAAFKMDISGSWKIDFQNQAARKLLEQNKMDVAQIFKRITNITLSKESYSTISSLGLMSNDYKFSPQIKNSGHRQVSSKIFQKYMGASQKNKDELVSSLAQLNTFSRRIDMSELRLSPNPYNNLSWQQNVTFQENNKNLNNYLIKSNQYQSCQSSPSSINSMSVYQFINNIKNSLRSQNIDASLSIQNSYRTKSQTYDKNCQKLQIQTFSLEDGVHLFSKEDIIKIYIVNNKYIVVIIENMEKYYDAAKNQVTKKVQNRMLQTISHEFGTYLSFLFSNLNISMQDQEVPEKMKTDYLIPFHQNVMLIYLLMQDFKDYQDILINRFKIRLIKSDIIRLFKESIDLVRKQAEDKQIQIKEHIQNIQSNIHIDPVRFKQILINLLQNSLKFSEQNTQIDIYLQHPSDDNEHIEVIVQDQGIGMDEEEQKALARLLQEGVSENRISANSSGYGFGLTVSNKIALKLNEEITCEKIKQPEPKKQKKLNQNQQGLYFESIPKKGSKFWFFINVEKSEYLNQQQQIMFQSISNQKKLMQTSIIMVNDQLIEFENRSHLTKTASLNHELRCTLQADSVFIDEQHKNKLNTYTAFPSPKLSLENKTFSIKQSLKQSNESIQESTSSDTKNIHNVPPTLQTNITNIHLSFINSSSENQSPKPPQNKANNSIFSFNNACQPVQRNLSNDFSKSIKSTENNRSIEEEQKLQISDHLPPIPNSNIEEKTFEVLKQNKLSDTELSLEQNDQIGSLNQINLNIGDLCRQQKSEMLLQSIDIPYILIVDDCQTNHYCLMLYLEKIFKISKKQILQAYNGVQGFEKFLQYQSKIKLIFMDLNMPIQNGKESTQQIREYEKENNLQSSVIVAYTAYSDPTTENECLTECGFNYFLAKPIADTNKLREILQYEELIS